MAGGDDVAPTVEWEGWPDAQSYAITCYDPDAPTGSGMWHWVLADIPAESRSVGPADESIVGVRAFQNDLGAEGYTGAAPPPGPAHRYAFTVWALNVPVLPAPPGSTNA